jgi:hypothetical protein
MTPSSPPAVRAQLRHRAGAALAALLTLSPVSAHTSDFTDFRIPKHTWTTATLDLSGWASRTKQTTEYETFRDRVLQGALGGSLAWRLDSEPIAAGVAGAGSLEGQLRDGDRRSEIFSRRHSSSDDRIAHEFVHLDAFIRMHPARGRLAFELGGSATERWRQEWEHLTTTDVSGSTFPAERRSEGAGTRRTFRQEVSAYVTAGVGRVRDATGVHQAWLVERRLEETGALVRPLSRRARRALATLHYLGGDYGVVYDRPQKRFWSDLVRLLQEDGAIEGDLDAFSLFRLLEPVHEARPVFIRQTGFFAGPTLQASNSRQESRIDETLWTRLVQGPNVSESFDEFHRSQRNSQDVVRAGFRGEAFFPLAPQTQLDVHSTVLLETQQPQDFVAASSIRFTHLIGERWAANVFADHQRLLHALDDPYHQSYWTVNYGAGLDYYLEDRWRIGLNVRESQRHEAAFASDFGRQQSRYLRDAHVSIGVSYHVLGVLDTDGFLPAMWAGDAPPR